MLSLPKYAAGIVALALASQPLTHACAQSEPAKSRLTPASVNPFAPPPASAPTATAAAGGPGGNILPPPLPSAAFAPSKLPALPLPPPPEAPLPTFDAGGHAVSEPRARSGDAENVIGRARQATNCRVRLSRTAASTGAAAGTIVLNFLSRTSRNCARAAMPDVNWIDVAELGDRAVTLGVKENESDAVRVGHVRIVSPDVGDAITVTVTQKAASGD